MAKNRKLRIGIIREEKVPPDSRVPLTPKQCKDLMQSYPVEIIAQPSSNRCYSDQEFKDHQVELSDDLSSCEVLLGVKEVPIPSLIPSKKYYFFSHTIKKQSYNRKLLQTILKKNITLIDYETLTDEDGQRVIAFGKFAGMVGAHNALWTFAQRKGNIALPRLKDLKDYATAKRIYQTIQWPPVKIVLTGTGRVANGAAMVLKHMGIMKVSPGDFLDKHFSYPVFYQLSPYHYVRRINGKRLGSLLHFYKNPEDYVIHFAAFTKTADILINGIYWDPKAPKFFSQEDMRSKGFKIKTISDVTCDIAPDSSIPSTLRPSTIKKPVYGFDPKTGKECQPYLKHSIDVMAIDNLPNEIPRDASKAFGIQFIKSVFPEILKSRSKLLEHATIAKNGQLTNRFKYLEDYVSG